ncbi:hypothetical protein JYU14_05270 [Simkania negevensis]|uniref:Uncharacterized protein n=1 Tax=Simkania negevensis TaxID=83561 RepID=A0ABS3ARW5_9BACT|nr:hypothetical protein [Simkania negevensis]
MYLRVKNLFLFAAVVAGFTAFFHAELNAAVSSENIPLVVSEREMLFDRLLEQLPQSSQAKNAASIKSIIEQLRYSGVCKLEGNDVTIRPGCVGLQCLLEETFLANSGIFKKADFEIHTTMPSTPCCKLPDERAKETLFASFKDEARLITIDGRSASLDAICDQPHAILHLTYTKAGFNQRSREEQMILMKYWVPRIHTTCIESHDAFPVEVNGATYRLLMPSGNEIFFGIKASQALHADDKSFVIHLGTKDQPEIKRWLGDLEKNLESFGRTLFAQ